MGLEKAQFKQKAEEYFNNRGVFASYTVQSAWLRYFLDSPEFKAYPESKIIDFLLIAGWIEEKIKTSEFPVKFNKNSKNCRNISAIFHQAYKDDVTRKGSSAELFASIGMPTTGIGMPDSSCNAMILWEPVTAQLFPEKLDMPLSQKILLRAKSKVSADFLTLEDALGILMLGGLPVSYSEKQLKSARKELTRKLLKEQRKAILADRMINRAFEILFQDIENDINESKEKYRQIISFKENLEHFSLDEIIEKISAIFKIDILKANETELKQALENIKSLVSIDCTRADIDTKAFYLLPELEKQCKIAIKAKQLLPLGSYPPVGNHRKKISQLNWANTFLDIIFRSKDFSYREWIENLRRKPYADLQQNLTNAYSIKSDYDALEKYHFEEEFNKLVHEETMLNQTLNELNPEDESYSNKLRDFLSRTECCLLKYVDFLKKIGEADAYDLKVPNKFQDDIVRLKPIEPDTKKSEKIGIVESRINACESLKTTILDCIEEDEISKALANMNERFLDRANKLSSNSLSGDKINIENLILALEEFEKFEEETKHFVENKVGTIRIACDDLRVEWTNRILPQKNRTFTTLEDLLNDPGECQKYDPNKFQEFKERIGKLNDQRKDYLLRLIQEKIDPPQSSSNQEIQDFLKIAIEKYQVFKHRKAPQREKIIEQANELLFSELSSLSVDEKLKIQYGFLLVAIEETQEDHNKSCCCLPFFRKESKLVNCFGDALKKYAGIITQKEGETAYSNYLRKQSPRPSTP